MDFLDPKKRFRHTLLLYSGYLLIGIAIAIATTVLLYEAYGFGLGKDGTVIQKGLLFMSSQPSPASIYIDGKLNSKTTNSFVNNYTSEFLFVLPSLVIPKKSKI